jgi:hypothetical protein
MKYLLCSLLLLPVAWNVRGQSYADTIQQYRKQYIADLLAEKRHPISPSQTSNLNFFPPDRSYCVTALVTEKPGATPFLIPTHSGKQKPFREYGTLTFSIHDTLLTLHVYQSMDLVNGAASKDELFIPFNDLTNYDLTYGGGRYIDLMVSDIKDGKVVLDFNKCYNPYCAYADGFSCPIPPSENRLEIDIKAGERSFRRW